jgi:hypothetical protein
MQPAQIRAEEAVSKSNGNIKRLIVIFHLPIEHPLRATQHEPLSHRNRSHDAVIRVYDASGNVIETHEHKGDFKEW